jgi:hypothetical protein
MTNERGKVLLDQAFDQLEHEVPQGLARFIRWLRQPKLRPYRLVLGVLCIAASFFWFLPVIGVEFLPLGLMLIAQDVPVLRAPTARLIFWMIAKWHVLRAWLQRWRHRAHIRRARRQDSDWRAPAP